MVTIINILLYYYKHTEKNSVMAACTKYDGSTKSSYIYKYCMKLLNLTHLHKLQPVIDHPYCTCSLYLTRDNKPVYIIN